MSDVINKKTGELLTSVRTPLYKDNDDYIINPTEEQIEEYKYKPSAEEIKSVAIMQKDMESAQILTSGYEIKEGVVMSTSLPAQTKWNSIMNMINMGEVVPLPHGLSLVNGDVYLVETIEEIKQIYKDAFLSKNQPYNEKLAERKIIFDGES